MAAERIYYYYMCIHKACNNYVASAHCSRNNFDVNEYLGCAGVYIFQRYLMVYRCVG